MEYVQISSKIRVPGRTAALAQMNPGVMTLLENGIDVLHYEDRREQEAEGVVARSGRLATLHAIIDSESYWGVGIGSPDYSAYSARMEP